MYHRLKLKKLNRTTPHRKSLFKNMSVALIQHEQIKTTLAKAKALRPVLEKLLTKAKIQNLNNRRYLISKLQNNDAVTKLINLAEKYKTRPGGYLRIVKLGFRSGDSAPMAYIEFIDRNVEAKGNNDILSTIKKDTKAQKKSVKSTEKTKKVANSESKTKNTDVKSTNKADKNKKEK